MKMVLNEVEVSPHGLIFDEDEATGCPMPLEPFPTPFRLVLGPFKAIFRSKGFEPNFPENLLYIPFLQGVRGSFRFKAVRGASRFVRFRFVRFERFVRFGSSGSTGSCGSWLSTANVDGDGVFGKNENLRFRTHSRDLGAIPPAK